MWLPYDMNNCADQGEFYPWWITSFSICIILSIKLGLIQ